MLGCTLSKKDKCTAAPMKRNMSSVQGPDHVIWLVGQMAGQAFLNDCHNGIITPWDKSLAVERRAMDSLKPDAFISG